MKGHYSDTLTRFLSGSYCQYSFADLTPWLSGKPKEIGWYDVKDSGQAAIERMYSISPFAPKVPDQIAGRAYWNGKYWSATVPHTELWKWDADDAEMRWQQNTRQQLARKYFLYRGLVNPPKTTKP